MADVFLITVGTLGFLIAITGVIFLFLWVLRTFSKVQLKVLGSRLISGGVLVMILAVLIWVIKGEDVAADITRPPTELTATELQGQTIYQRLGQGEVNCGDLTTEQFMLIGRYMMAQRSRDAYTEMNTSLESMMGRGPLEQVYLYLGRRMTGCSGT